VRAKFDFKLQCVFSQFATLPGTPNTGSGTAGNHGNHANDPRETQFVPSPDDIDALHEEGNDRIYAGEDPPDPTSNGFLNTILIGTIRNDIR
jgi:hypothetical protein